MTASEKVVSLYDKFEPLCLNIFTSVPEPHRIKKCCLICVDEILCSWGKYNGEIDNSFYPKELEFWNDVRNEIEKL